MNTATISSFPDQRNVTHEQDNWRPDETIRASAKLLLTDIRNATRSGESMSPQNLVSKPARVTNSSRWTVVSNQRTCSDDDTTQQSSYISRRRFAFSLLHLRLPRQRHAEWPAMRRASRRRHGLRFITVNGAHNESKLLTYVILSRVDESVRTSRRMFRSAPSQHFELINVRLQRIADAMRQPSSNYRVSLDFRFFFKN